MTGNGVSFRSHHYAKALPMLKINRKRTRPYTPRQTERPNSCGPPCGNGLRQTPLVTVTETCLDVASQRRTGGRPLQGRDCYYRSAGLPTSSRIVSPTNSRTFLQLLRGPSESTRPTCRLWSSPGAPTSSCAWHRGRPVLRGALLLTRAARWSWRATSNSFFRCSATPSNWICSRRFRTGASAAARRPASSTKSGRICCQNIYSSSYLTLTTSFLGPVTASRTYGQNDSLLYKRALANQFYELFYGFVQ